MSEKKRWMGAIGLMAVAALIIFGLNYVFTDMKRGSLAQTEEVSVAESEFVSHINSNVTVKDGKANFLIENNENNHNSCRVKVYGKENAVLLYESDVIPTGYYIEEAKLFEDIPEGESEGYAVFEILDESSNIKSTLTVDLHFTVS